MKEFGQNEIENTFFTAIWVNDEASFIKAVPLELLANSITKFNSKFKFNLVFIEGIEKLSTNYLNKITTLGFNVIDYSIEFEHIKSKYAAIINHYSKYEAYCFLRWIVFKNINKNNSQFIHFDSDVIFFSSLDTIFEYCQGKTFMLQGCPVMLSISDNKWFEMYENELMKLSQDLIGYSDIAFNEKTEITKNDKELCNQSLYRNPIGSDQDFLEYLISSKKIIQLTSQQLFNSNFYLNQNVLAINVWHKMQMQNTNAKFCYESNGNILIDNKIVPFIHFQTTFTRYAETYLFLNKFFSYNSKTIRLTLKFEIINTLFKTNMFYLVARKVMKTFKIKNDRTETMMELMTTDSKNNTIHLVNLINLVLKK